MPQKPTQPLTTFQKIFLWYLLAATILSLCSLSQGFGRAVCSLLILMGLFGVIAGMVKRSAAKDMRILAAVLGVLLFVPGVAWFPSNTSGGTADAAAHKAAPTKVQAVEKPISETTKKAPAPKPAPKLYRVTSITDGDTIKVDIDGKIETIRFIGMDTPETKDPRKPVQCYGKEASSRMQHYVQSKSVALEADASQGNRDKYDRLLRYVFLEDGTNVALQMIREGYAHEYTYDKPYKYQAAFKAAEATAKANGSGFWATNTCNGDTTQAAESATPAATPTQSDSSVYYANCTEVRAAGAAPIYAGQPGYSTKLDRDRDGVACE